MPGRQYVEVLSVNGTSYYAGNGDPNGVFSAERGSLLSDKDAGGKLWRNIDGAMTWQAELQYDPTGEVQGSVLYHDGTDWVVLPPGVAGRFLRTNGPGADPTWSPGGAGGASPFVATNEWFVDSTAVADPAMRIFPTIETALADLDAVLPAGEEGLVRLRDGQTHPWDGTSMPSGRDIVIWCPVSTAGEQQVYCGVSLTSPFNVQEDVFLTFQNVNLTNSFEFGVFEFGLFGLRFINCSGIVLLSILDAPTVAVLKDITFDGCQGLVVRLIFNDTGGGSVFCQCSQLSTGLSGVFLNNSAALGVWRFTSRNQSQLNLPANSGILTAIDTVESTITDTDITVDMSQGGTFTLTNWTVVWGGANLRVFNYDSDIDTFLFGDPGFASPFQFVELGPLQCWFTDPSGEVDQNYPQDAPIGTQAVGNFWLGVATLDYGQFNPQWRGPLDSVRMGQRTTVAVPANFLISVLDGTQYIASHIVGGSTHYLVTGTITAMRSGVPGTAAAWSVTALVQQTAAGVLTFIVNTVTVISNVPGYADPVLTAVNSQGVQIDVDQLAVGGDNDWTAMLQINEQTIAI